MYSHKNPKNDEPAPLVSDDVYEVIMQVGTGDTGGAQTGNRQRARLTHVDGTRAKAKAEAGATQVEGL